MARAAVLIRLRYAVLGVVIAAFGAGVPAAIVTGAVKAGYVQVSRSGAGREACWVGYGSRRSVRHPFCRRRGS